MLIIQEPNTLELLNKLHFEQKKNGEYIPFLKYSVPIFVEIIYKMQLQRLVVRYVNYRGRLASKGWTRPSVQSTTGRRGVRISGSNAGYTTFRGSVKGTGYPLHSPFSPSLLLPRVIVCHHISIGFYQLAPWVWVSQSVQRLSRGWTVWSSSLGGCEIFRTFTDRTQGPIRLL